MTALIPNYFAFKNSPPPKPSEISKTRAKSFFVPRRITASYTGGKGPGIGHSNNYTTLEVLFASLYHPGHFVALLVDFRGHHFADNKYAANAGVIFRYVPKSATFSQLLGWNVYYDFRQGKRGLYNQAGVGLESLGTRWDFRANGYFPVGRTKNKHVCVYDQYIGNYFMITNKKEAASVGCNAEVGYYLVNSDSFSLYAATGPYFLSKTARKTALGGEFRLRPQYKDYVAMNFQASYDPVFQWSFQATLSITLPLYQIPLNQKSVPSGIRNWQVYQPVQRFDIISLERNSCIHRNF